MFYSFNYTVKSGGVCNRLPTLCRDRHLEGSKTATLYIDLSINIACRSPFPFRLSITPSLPPSSCIYRASRATFYNQVVHAFPHSAKLTRYEVDRKGRGRKEVIYLHVADVSCTRGVRESTGLSYGGPYCGVP